MILINEMYKLIKIDNDIKIYPLSKENLIHPYFK